MQRDFKNLSERVKKLCENVGTDLECQVRNPFEFGNRPVVAFLVYLRDVSRNGRNVWS